MKCTLSWRQEPVKLPAELNDEPRDAERLSAPMAHLVTEAKTPLKHTLYRYVRM